MKRGIAFVLSIILLLSAMSTFVFAVDGEESDELTNIARVESALAYSTSEKNTLWTPAYALNDGLKSSDTWQGWECKYPDIIYGSDTSNGFSGEYCGIKFLNKEYYEIYSMNINVGLHAAMGGQNPHYTVQCLVEGVWVTVKEFNDSDTTPVSGFSSYEDAMENDTSFYHIGSQISFTLDEPVTTNNVRITLSEFAKNYPGGDVLIFPYIYEIELIGKRGEAPEIELPEGAVISSNIGYHSYPKSSSSASFRYPYCAIDGKAKTYWAPKGKEAGEYLVLEFDSLKKINKAVVNFGEYFEGISITDYAFDIEAFIDSQWVKLASGTSVDEENKTMITEYAFNEVETKAIRLIFTQGYTKAPTVYEFEAHMSSEKTYYVENRFDEYQRTSASKGNIAIIGTPYANLDFLPYSDINYIVDGKIDKDAYVWFTGVIDMPAYCGVKFNEKQLIDRVALYFNVPDVEGVDIMSIQIQALIDGEYVTLISTKSYDKDLKYSPAFQFDPVETDDIRILYTAGNGTFAHLKEIEIYSPYGKLPMFDSLTSSATPPTFIDYSTPESTLDANENGSVEEVSFEKAVEEKSEHTMADLSAAVLFEGKEDKLLMATVVVGAASVLLLLLTAVVVYINRKKSK